MSRTITVTDPLQRDYTYECVAPVGKNFDPAFMPDLTPKEMLELGVFGGTYFEHEHDEFPESWFVQAKLSELKYTPKLNYFGVRASQSRAEWEKNGWIYVDDPRGWFQWYCRYYMGRRIPHEDARQIRRWAAMGRHILQIKNNCRAGDEACRPRQRQAVLHWSYDSRKM
jgi:hypothetical protein